MICGFAHRRLRVIDLSPLAAQPMQDDKGGLVVMFNGEIYNFVELRGQLEELGYNFKSRSDTEVLLHGFAAWQESLFEKLRGMFAIAIWEKKNHRLLLARDRLGKKPLFFSTGNDSFVFGSELTVFRELPFLGLSISSAAFAEYVEFGYVQHPRTILNEVMQLPPGCYGVVSRQGLSTHTYWSLPQTPAAPEEASHSLETTLRKATACRLVSDVPLGCFLSGGIDSSLIAAYAQEEAGSKLKTYSVAFEASAMNEAPFAAAIAKHLGTDHHEIRVTAESVIEEFPAIFSHLSEPIGDDSYLPTYIISRETRREVTVALSGDGGDELFCGYDKYARLLAARRLRRLLPAGTRRAALALVGQRGGDKLSKSLEALAAPDDEHMARWLSSLWKRSELPKLLATTTTDQPDFFDCSWNRYRSFPLLERFMLVDMETYLTNDILAKVDRASMAHGLETRAPFLDKDVVDIALKLSSRAHPGKAILKKMLEKRVPLALFDRPKSGFGMPINDWYRGPLHKLLESYTSPARITKRGLLNSETVQHFVQAHLSGRRNFGRKLHAIVAFEMWADTFFA